MPLHHVHLSGAIAVAAMLAVSCGSSSPAGSNGDSGTTTGGDAAQQPDAIGEAGQPVPEGGPSDAAGGEGGGGSDGGAASSGTLEVVVTVLSIAQNGTPASGAAIEASVRVSSMPGPVPVDGATVTIGPPGNEMPATAGAAGSGRYALSYAGYSSEIDLDVRHGSDFLTGVRLRMPQYYATAFTPAMPTHGAAAQLTWTPSGESDVTLSATFTSSAATSQVGPDPDTGAATLPATTFASAGPYSASVTRARTQMLASPSSTATLTVEIESNVTVQ